MSHSSYLNKYVLKLVQKNIENQHILDVGCGYGLWGYALRINMDFPPTIIGLDVWKPYLAKTKQTRLYDGLIQGYAPKLPLPNKLFDLTICIALLPHLKKTEAVQFLGELERVGRHVIVSTHFGFSSQDDFDGNPCQEHLSSWYPEDFIDKGYKTVTVPSTSRKMMPLYLLDSLIFNPTKKPLKGEIIAWK